MFGVTFCFEIYVLVYLYSFLISLFCIVYYVLCFRFLFCCCCGSLTHNEDIVTFRCGGGESRSCFLQKKVTRKNLFVGFWEFCAIFDWL